MNRFYLLIFLIIPTFSGAQTFTLNKGNVKEPGYFTVIDYQNIRGKVIVNATIANNSYRFILDTGAPTMITKKVFDQLGLTTTSHLPIKDGNNRPDSLIASQLREITLGGIVFNDVPVLVANDPLLFDCHKVDGFIGSNLLRNSIISISPKEMKLTLTDQVEKLMLNQRHAADLVLNKSQSSPYISVRLKNKKSAAAMVLFDTGMEGLYDVALEHYRLLEKGNIFKVSGKSNGNSTLSLNGAGTDTLQYRLHLAELQINSAVFRNVNAQTTASGNSRIGSELLDYGKVTVDYLNKKFYFEPLQTINDAAKDQFPLAMTIKENKLVVGIVWQDSLMGKVKIGDQILRVDDKDYSKFDTCEFINGKSIFEGKEQVTLTIVDANGESHSLVIRRSAPLHR